MRGRRRSGAARCSANSRWRRSPKMQGTAMAAGVGDRDGTGGARCPWGRASACWSGGRGSSAVQSPHAGCPRSNAVAADERDGSGKGDQRGEELGGGGRGRWRWRRRRAETTVAGLPLRTAVAAGSSEHSGGDVVLHFGEVFELFG